MSVSAAAAKCADKMRAHGVSESAIAAFLISHKAVESGDTGFIPEADIEPAADLPYLTTIATPENAALLNKTVIIKLNGGLGTGMGLSNAKSLLEVKKGETFLDFIAKQVLQMREQYKVPLKFMLMNSFSTSDDTRKFFEKYPEFAAVYDEIEFLQNKVPKIRQDDFTPAEYPADPEVEFCPPGHGDIYAALLGSGKLEALLKAGYKYAFVSNSDNLGATMDLRILSFLEEQQLEFAMEVCERSEADKKGGHLARAKKTGNLLLRESAQCPKEDEGEFQNIKKHCFFNTNNLWVNLEALQKAMEANGGLLPLPVIRNSKTVNPTDKASTKVYQLETAMGTAISLFAKATAIVVPRTRFAPVKTCNDLLALRSDCYVVTPDFRLVLADSREGNPPVVALDDDHYKFVSQFEALVAKGVPRMLGCKRLTIKGKASFAADVTIDGAVSFVNKGSEAKEIASGAYKDQDVEL